MLSADNKTSRKRVAMVAPAKVNLYLGVGELRPDGYHEVETVLHTIDLSDTIVLEAASGLSLQGAEALNIPAEENLASRAAAALALRVGREPDVRITLTKRIPAGAGLGGASSDAAAVLAGLPILWGEEIDLETLTQVASGLGADVPFFLTGATALYSGRGDVFVSTVPSPVLELAVVKPSSPVPTARAYAAFDRLGGQTGPGPAELLAACEARDVTRVGRALYNNMTGAAVELVPEIAAALALCDAGRGVVASALAGSGSAVFAVCESAWHAEQLAAHAAQSGFWSCATRSADIGVHVAEGDSD